MYSSTVPDNSGGLFHADHTARASYRREFEEMESRIRRCERQRAELERQFEDLMRERADCEKAAVRAMRQRQRRQMEVERQRAERNESILRMLNKIDQQAASLAAKTDRLKMLKTQYEMYLMRTWSTAPPALPSYSVPMITAPPVVHTKLPQSPQKSEFVQYLSELTHQQTASISSIPPPTALSNYLASQQKPFVPASSHGAGIPQERPYSRAFNSNAGAQDDLTMVHYGVNSAQMTLGGTKANKFEMSNEDFIRYIDSEVLKDPIPKVSIVAPSPVVEEAEVKQAGEPYLEDAIMSEDEPVGELSNKMKEFSIKADAEAKNDTLNNSAKGPAQGESKQLDEVMENALEYLASSETIMPENEDHSFKEQSLVEADKDDREKIVETNSQIEHAKRDNVEQDVQELQANFIQPEMNIPYDDAEIAPVIAENSHGLHSTMRQEDFSAANDVMYEPSGESNVNYLQETQRTDENVYNPVQTEESLYDNQQYSTSNEVSQPEPAPELNAQQLQQPTLQSGTRNQHWTTARQALRSKAFPGATSKPPSPETDLHGQTGQQVAQHGIVSAVPEEISNSDQAVVQNDASVAEYPAYSVESNDPYYQTDVSGGAHQSTEQMQAPVSQGFHNDAMGQPVEYQQEDVQQSAAYQYASQQEGQYVEGEAGESQYQYQEAIDPTASSYATQEGYQDPNQQYQYDENAQYYNDQQAYDAQYYNQDPQQQQQQYYMDESNQQQEGQYEQQVGQSQDHPQQIPATDQYPTAVEPNDQTVYYPSDGQYEQTAHNPEQLEPLSSATTAAAGDPAQVVDEPKPVETSAAIDTTLVKDKQEKKGTEASPQQPTVEQKPSARKEAPDPGSDVPTLSTVNDESDFDFSSQ
ncbi:uncharacterized protein LOC128298664 [Anopheles moucheti]|uniref:uncharacterized protein LOC128298664 n=1 Tax=Anopheles moucheti TaxID=186751 RepID=UPI0022F0BB78|nr:uncharacterized protein LOC128298664 [Anopheles moucheti]